AAHDEDILAGLGLDWFERRSRLAREENRVHPRQGAGERPRRHVLTNAVEPRREGALGPLGPHAVEILIRTSAQQQRAGGGEYLTGLRHRRVRSRPAAVLEAIAGVLIRTPGSLHDAVEAHVGTDNNFTHGLKVRATSPAPQGGGAASNALTFLTNEERIDRLLDNV